MIKPTWIFERTITDFLAASEPATLEEILRELQDSEGLKAVDVLPVAIAAIAALEKEGKICEYPQFPFEDPLQYAWILAENA